MAVNILLMLMMLPEDFMDLNNWIELSLWISSIAGLLSNNKWGTALALFTLIYTLSTSVSIIIYYQVWLNLVRVIINTALIAYVFKHLLKT
jgi:cellulose synthase/poly-beta-1,6-N-acetylglucosamine synthase-like glycosyltransferase